LKTIISTLDYRNSNFISILTAALVVFLAVCSIVFKDYFQLDIYYIFPVTLASWYGSKTAGLTIALASTASLILFLLVYDLFGIYSFFSHILPFLIALSLLAILVTDFRSVHRVEAIAADTDALTKIANSRRFYFELANELERSSRYGHIFSLAYIDIDDFKLINDTLGHVVGDKLLKEVANSLKDTLRNSDIVARLGGDEFACLLPETAQVAAKSAFIKVREHLQESMKERHWSVSFSIGLVTFEVIPKNIKEAIGIADNLMYSVKRSRKDNISYKVWLGNI